MKEKLSLFDKLLIKFSRWFCFKVLTYYSSTPERFNRALKNGVLTEIDFILFKLERYGNI